MMGLYCSTLDRDLVVLENFCFYGQIGFGSYSTVWKVVFSPDSQVFAMKIVPKKVYFSRNCITVEQNERKILPELFDTSIVNLHYAFQSATHIYLVLDYMPGGNLREYLRYSQRISENDCRFLVACILTSLQYLHSHKILHHDIKPENLMFDYKSYLILTDFGISQKLGNLKPNKSGSLPYIAPEVLYGNNYNIESDYFSVGVIMFEILEGTLPFEANTRETLKSCYYSKQIEIRNTQGWSDRAVQFIQELLTKNAAKRLGNKGFEQVKAHKWLKDVDWEGIKQQTIESPFVGKIREIQSIGDHVKNTNFPQEKFIPGFFYSRKQLVKKLN